MEGGPKFTPPDPNASALRLLDVIKDMKPGDRIEIERCEPGSSADYILTASRDLGPDE